MTAHLLTLNAGSSSIKFALFPVQPEVTPQPGGLPVPLWAGQADGLGPGLTAHLRTIGAQGEPMADLPLGPAQATHAGALQALLGWMAQHAGSARIAAVGHRIVHGGMDFTAPVQIDAAVLAALQALEPLAPLHQPHNVAGIRAAMLAFPGVAQFACFDTAFHATQSDVNRRFALPRSWHDAGVRRYGFHGLSYQSIVAQLGNLDPALAHGRVVVAHLGNGASLCAMHGGRSVATTMSFSPLDGLTMGTRCGRIDAAVVLYLLQQRGMTAEQITTLLFRESGLLGLSGVSSDMRVLEASAQPEAAYAIAHFVEQVVQQLGNMVAAMRGVDAIVFTGGMGENAIALRARLLAECAWLGVQSDAAANQAGGPRLTVPASPVSAWVLKTNEEAMIARSIARMLLAHAPE